MRTKSLKAIGLAFLLAAASVALYTGCMTVGATGEQHLNLMGEQQEIQMGREADGQIVATMGLYPDEALQGYVKALGEHIAATTERPNLPWTFRVVDDEVVNAFALPGGFIYVTRGILSTLNNEAQLAGVLGHEIGHVTAMQSACYEKRSMLITTNLEFGRWVNIFLDQTMTTALIDRLVHHSHLLIFDGESHRVKNSLMRR